MSARLRSLLGASRRFLVGRLPAPSIDDRSRACVGDTLLTAGRVPARLLSLWHTALAWLFEKLEQPDRAVPHAVRSSILDPGRSRAVTRAVRLALATGPSGIVRTANVGLTIGRLGDTELATELIQRAADHAAPDNTTRLALVRTAMAAGRLEDAEAMIAACDAGHEVDRVRADLLQLIGRARGGLLVREAAELIELWERILVTAPADSIIRDRLVRHLVWMGEYGRARHIAWATGDDGTGSEEAVAPTGAPVAAPNEWFFAAHAEALARGDAQRSHDLKLQIATRLASSPPGPAAPCWRFIEAMRAASYLGEGDRAAALIEQRLTHHHRPVDELALRKLAADLSLANGDPEPIIAVRSSLASPSQHAERRFADAIGGARVLVVGPAPDTQPSAHDIDAADVVVFTKRPRACFGDGRTTIVYPSDSSVLLESPAVATSLSSSAGVDMLVLRPSIVGLPGRSIPQDGTVRVMPCEDSNALLGTRLGVQRIVYDLLAYRPAELLLSGVDFFLGSAAYVDGYANEATDIYAPNGLQPARSFAPHDHLWCYRFIRHLHAVGAIRATEPVEALLGLDDDEYLARLGERLRAAAEGSSVLGES